MLLRGRKLQYLYSQLSAAVRQSVRPSAIMSDRSSSSSPTPEEMERRREAQEEAKCLAWKYQDITPEFYQNLEDATGIKNLSSLDGTPPQAAPSGQPTTSIDDTQKKKMEKLKDYMRYFALNPSQHQMLLPDVDERFYKNLSFNYDVEHLSVSDAFPTPSFPVNGAFFGNEQRMVVPLNIQWDRNPSAPIVCAWFVVMTGSNSSFINEETMRALTGSASTEDRPLSAIRAYLQERRQIVELYLSHGDFKDANVLGMDTLQRIGLTIKAMNFRQLSWRLAKIN